MKFKVGDTVRLIKKRDFEFVIKDIGESISGKEVYLPREGEMLGYNEDELELIEDTSNYITTKDFVKEVEKLGYHLGEYTNDAYIENKKSELIAYISYKTTRAVQTYGLIDEVLFDLLIKYAKTPIEFREEPKKYYIPVGGTDKFIAYSFEKQEIRFYKQHNPHANGTFKSEFTFDELVRLPDYGWLNLLKKVEVNE